MGFKDDLMKLSAQVEERKEFVTNEETAKHSLIMPFLQVMGFDVFNPVEVRPEYDADFGKKKGEKVDYAVFKDGSPIMFIEAKSLTEKLDNHDSQLARYFNATPGVKLAVITNGVDYKFFTDLNTSNIMDDSPFLQICLTDLTDSDVYVLSRFKKDAFDTQEIVSFAEELIYTSNLNTKLAEIFKDPPDEFIRFLLRGITETKITQNVIERFRPIVKRSIQNVIVNIVGESLQSRQAVQDQIEAAAALETPSNDNHGQEESEKHVVTTEEELRGFAIVQDILSSAGLDTSEVSCKDTLSYFGIHFRNTWSWFVRLLFDTSKKQVVVRLPLERIHTVPCELEITESSMSENAVRIYIQSVEDIYVLRNIIEEAYKEVTSPHQA